MSASTPAKSEVKALLFDVFGTLVDWRGTIIREGEQVWTRLDVQVDWPSFADAWRGGYQPAMHQVRQGRRPWANLDVLHRELLDSLLAQFAVHGLTNDDVAYLNRIWHRLTPWPDVVSGLSRLKQYFIIAPLSNGHIELLVNLSKFAGLPWDCILSAELAKQYKPEREVYLNAISLLGLRPHQTMMVAAHLDDLIAAKSVGMQTAFIHRPWEFGPAGKHDQPTAEQCDWIASDLHDLARQIIKPDVH
jgi:2-haloacid dehalogenase